MLLKNKAVSEKRVAANQANAKHSTGPRNEQGKKVSSQNNFKHGFYAQMQPEVMAVLHEDPLEKVRILTGLSNSYNVENSAQQMVVDDIFDLRWQRIQVVRSQEAKMGLRVKGVERQRDMMHLQINHDVADVPQAEVLEKGLRNIADSPAKFGALIDKLNALIKQAEERDYSSALPYLTAIYGKQASPRGATIFNVFLDLGRLQRERQAALEARRPWPPPGDPVWKEEDAPKKGDPPGYDPRLDLPNEALLMYLNMELHEVQKCYSFFVEDKIIVTQMNRDAAIAPTLDSLPAARVLWMIDRDIDAKTRLLMKMLVEDRKRRLILQQDEEADDAGSSGAPPKAGAGPRQTVGEEEGSSAAGPEADSGQDAGPDEASGADGEDVEVNDAQGKADPEPVQTPEAPFRSAVGTTSLLILTLVLHLVLSLTHVSLTQGSVASTSPLRVEAGLSRHLPDLTQELAVGTSVLQFKSKVAILPQLQRYPHGPQVRAVECGSAATALASLPTHRAKCGSSVTDLAPRPELRRKGGSPAAAAFQGGLRPQTGEFWSAVGTPPLQFGQSKVATPPQLQPYPRGPQVRALECGSAATALASLRTRRAKCGSSVAGLATPHALRRKGGSIAAALKAGCARRRTNSSQR
ncbi:MAG TPA: hypothetical protein VKM93_14485 [Terriglobia bacterium]|nr:hypothetical protein [Terriglobia bacterium]